MDYRVHGILQARTLEWVAFPFSRGSSQPRHRTQVSPTAGRFFTSWATREALLYKNYGCISQVLDNIEPAWLMSLARNIKKSYWLASPWISKRLPKWHSGKKTHLPVQETGDTVWFLCQEDPLEEEMATHSRTLAWKIPWTEEPGRLQSMGSQRAGHDWAHMPGFLNYNTSHTQLILEKAMATHSSTLAWRIPWTEEPGGLLFIGSQSRIWLKWLSMRACIGEGNGNPLQYACLENPMDRGA